MIVCNLSEIALVLNAKHIGVDVIIDTISINSNHIINKCMFVALAGKRFDGHDFIGEVIAAGVRAILVKHYVSCDIPQLIVENTYNALLTIAYWVRSRVSSKVIAITGSSGKTSVKEMTAEILRCCGKVVATYKNFNNYIGVPITLLNLTNQSDFGVIELGTSKSGELQRLSKLVAADVALVNNIFPSHLSGFKSFKAIKKEKGEIFSALSTSGQAVINADNNAYAVWRAMLKGKRIWRFSLHNREGSNFFASNIVLNENGIQFVLNSPYGSAPVFLSMLLGVHNIVNALAATALAFSVGANLFDIINGLRNVKSIPGRLHPVSLNRGKILLLDDTYNANVGSMVSAICVLNKMLGYRILVISDMLELGILKSIKYHCYIGKLIMKTDINQVLTIGKFSSYISKICKRGKHFQNKSELIFYIKNILLEYKNNKIILLIKGSRGFHMEQVVESVKDYVKCYYGR